MKLNRLWLTLLPCLWTPAVVLADDALPYLNELTLRDGQKLTKVQVLKVEPDGLRVEHSSGVGKLTLEVLPSEVAKRFHLSEAAAAQWREADKKRKDEAAALERREAVKQVLEASRADQDSKVRQQRLALYQQMRSGTFNYVDADAELRKSIALYKEADRPDLAALLEEDRDVLKQQEVYRPSADLEAKKQELANRVSQLETDLANARNQPPTIIYTPSDPVVVQSSSIYYNPDPFYVPVPYNPPLVRPPGGRPAWMGPPGTRPPVICPPGTVPASTSSNGFPNAALTPPPTIGPRQPNVRQPETRQPSVPPVAVRQPNVVSPQVLPPSVRQTPVIQPAPRPVPVRPAAPSQPSAPAFRPAPSSPPPAVNYPANGGGGGNRGGAYQPGRQGR